MYFQESLVLGGVHEQDGGLQGRALDDHLRRRGHGHAQVLKGG
jgi:hypothetical protein